MNRGIYLMKKQYLEPEMTALSVDAVDVIATSGERDDVLDYDSVWNNIPTA